MRAELQYTHNIYFDTCLSPTWAKGSQVGVGGRELNGSLGLAIVPYELKQWHLAVIWDKIPIRCLSPPPHICTVAVAHQVSSTPALWPVVVTEAKGAMLRFTAGGLWLRIL